MHCYFLTLIYDVYEFHRQLPFSCSRRFKTWTTPLRKASLACSIFSSRISKTELHCSRFHSYSELQLEVGCFWCCKKRRSKKSITLNDGRTKKTVVESSKLMKGFGYFTTSHVSSSQFNEFRIFIESGTFDESLRFNCQCEIDVLLTREYWRWFIDRNLFQFWWNSRKYQTNFKGNCCSIF